MPIAVTCSCGAKLSVPDSMAGKEGTCPTCKAKLAVPGAGGASSFSVASHDLTASRDLAVSGDAEEAEPATATRTALASPPAPKTPTMRFRCPRCRKTLKVALRFAGLNGKCAGCGASFTAPVPPHVKAPAPAPPPSLRAAFAFEKVRCACGVTFARGRADGECPACGRLLPQDASG